MKSFKSLTFQEVVDSIPLVDMEKQCPISKENSEIGFVFPESLVVRGSSLYVQRDASFFKFTKGCDDVLESEMFDMTGSGIPVLLFRFSNGHQSPVEAIVVAPASLIKRLADGTSLVRNIGTSGLYGPLNATTVAEFNEEVKSLYGAVIPMTQEYFHTI